MADQTAQQKHQAYGPHHPVLLQEVLKTLKVARGGVYVDATFGAGGYTRAILNSADCKVYSIDRDRAAKKYVENMLPELRANFYFREAQFANIYEIIVEQGAQQVNGIVFDVGVSSMQLDEGARGFSFMREGPLDMRMDAKQALSAAEVVNTYSEEKLSHIIQQYGGERKARRIASAIVMARRLAPITSTLKLASVVSAAAGSYADSIHSATRTFQAIRVYVNDELNQLTYGLEGAKKLLALEGILCVVTFHSLEDKIVKKYFASICPKKEKVNKYQVNTTAHSEKPAFVNLYQKPIQPSALEIKNNPRARSAKMRAIMRII